MSLEFEIVAIWVGRFDSKRTLNVYLKETYSGEPEDDDKPISRFAADQGETFYDHDFLEAEFLKNPLSIAKILERHSYSHSYRDAALAATADLRDETFNVSLLVWGNEITKPRSVSGKGYELRFLGSFPCESAS